MLTVVVGLLVAYVTLGFLLGLCLMFIRVIIVFKLGLHEMGLHIKLMLLLFNHCLVNC